MPTLLQSNHHHPHLCSHTMETQSNTHAQTLRVGAMRAPHVLCTRPARKKRSLALHSQRVSAASAGYAKLERAVLSVAFTVCPTFVPFPANLQHIARTAAALGGSRGHVLLLGADGTGRTTSALIAAAATGLRAVQPPPPALSAHGKARLAPFLDAFKVLLLTAGVEGERVCMVVTDEHLADAAVAARVAAVLSKDMHMERPFAAEEWEQHVPAVRARAERRGAGDSPAAVYAEFLRQAFERVHVAIVAAPATAALRTALRRHPVLLDRCAVDAHTVWPRPALHTVAARAVAALDDVPPAAHAPLAHAAVAVHEAAAAVAVTPPVLHLRVLRMLQARCAARSTALRAAQARAATGAAALRSAQAAVTDMRAELQRLGPALEARSAAAAELQGAAARDAEAASTACAAVAKEEAEVAREAAGIAALRDEAQAAVAEVEPVLAAALEALGALNRSDLNEIKTFTKPPALVQVTMEAVCLLLGERSDWDGAKRVRNCAVGLMASPGLCTTHAVLAPCRCSLMPGSRSACSSTIATTLPGRGSLLSSASVPGHPSRPRLSAGSPRRQ
jgi:dynein heavy chain, axonemal